MKLVKLEFAAFGPFKNNQTIDFENINNAGIFLISGKTGCGKSTIFDAICYALFGEVTSKDKPNKGLKSDHADKSEICEIKLIFEVGETQYTVKRIPAQIGLKKNKEEKQIVAEAELEYGSVVLNKITEVNNKIKELFQMDVHQFRQIVMLPQGKFKELLFSNSENKAKILKQIYQINDVEDFVKKLKHEYDKHKKIDDELRIKIDSEKEKLDIKNVLDETIDTISEELYNKSIEFEKERKNIGKLTLEKETLIRQIISGKENNKNIEKLTNVKEKLRNLVVFKPTIESYKIKIKAKESAKVVANKEQQFIEKEKDLQFTNKELARISKLIEEESKNLKDLGEIKDLKEFHENLATYKNYRQEVNLLIENNSKVKNNQHIFKSEKTKLEKSKKELDIQQSILHDIKVKYSSSIAGILAKVIKEGEACPVCGSLTHPNLATAKYEDISKERIEDEADKLKTYENAYNEMGKTIVKISTSIEGFIKDNKRIERKSNYKYDSYVDNQKSINEEIFNLEKTIANEKINKQKRKSINENLIKYDTQKKSEIKSIDTLTEKVKDYKKELDVLVKASFKSYEEYEDALSVDDESLSVKVSQYSNDKTESDAVMNSYKEYENMKVAQVDILEEKQLNIERNIADKENKYNEEKDNLKSKKEHFDELSKLLKLKKENEEPYNKVSFLYKLATGKLPGSKLTFENFVLAHYFEEIIAIANVKLKDMTSSRYQLQINQESSGNAKQGLDLLIFDNHTSKSRDVKTISGGESFKVSLALALALSESAQLKSSGLELNNLFIDEGFGTLDPESLDQTVEVLMELKNDGKLVGIISHVDLLKENIDTQIQIDTSNKGSSLKVVQ
jgi:exonuclease SbcC